MMPLNSALLLSAAVLWPKVTVQTMLEPVPSFQWVGIPGAVQPAPWRTAKPVNDACPIYDDAGRVIGASLACKDSRK